MKEVLDHGWVELLDIMGEDCSPATAARVSTGTEPKGWDNGDGRLTEYLWSHQHFSPFEMVELKFAVKAPIFITRQWMRHRAGSFNEFSMRYAEADKVDEGLEIYTPEYSRAQHNNNKQGSSQSLFINDVEAYYLNSARAARTAYYQLLAAGVSREQARLVLPVSTYTKFYWKVDFRNFIAFAKLRDHEDAQWEMQQYAKACKSLVEEKLPNLMRVTCS